MIYNEENDYPVLIDFGLSIPIDKITKSNITDYFYIYAPDYYYWSLEIHILNYSLHITYYLLLIIWLPIVAYGL